MKFFTITVLSLSFVAAQDWSKIMPKFVDGSPDLLVPEPPSCPKGGLEFYKNCRGPINQCSSCLGNAELECKKALKQSCSGCTIASNSKCGSETNFTCYGDQECDKDSQCVNGQCVRT